MTQTYVVKGLTTALPAVTGLNTILRDGLTTLVWNRVTDIRNLDYEVRIGPSWANSRTIAITSGLNMLAVGNGLYWVAARFAGNGLTVYGPPDSLQIAGAAIVRNLLVTVNEAPAWTGTLSPEVYVEGNELTLLSAGDILAESDVLALDNALAYGVADHVGTYQTHESNVVDIGYEASVRVDFEISEYAYNFNESITIVQDILAEADVLNESNRQHYRIRPQIRTAGDDAVFSAWQEHVPGMINARYFDVRIVIETDDLMIKPYVESFTWSIDVPDMIQKGEGAVVADTGITVTYDKAFHAIPNVQITWLDAMDGDRYVLTNSDEQGFDIRFYNGSTPVERTMNWISQGY